MMMMISFFLHCTLLAALVLSSTFSCIIKADPTGAAASFCSAFSSPSSQLQGQVNFSLHDPQNEDHARTLTLFHGSSLSLHDEDQSLSFTITANSTDEDEYRAPTLAFILMNFPPSATSPSSIRYMEVSLSCKKEQCQLNTENQPLPPSISDVCGVHPQQPPPIPTSPYSCLPLPYPLLSNQTQVLLTYDADTATIQVQEVIISGDDLTSNCTFNFTLDAPNSGISNETTTLLVGSITIGEAIISDISYHTDENSESNHKYVVDTDENSKSKHKHVVVWVIVGVSSMMAILIGLLILVLFITKRRRERPSIVSSRPAGHRVPPTPSKAPFPYHDLESSPTPMMRALPLSPPYDTKEFQISGTASWLKQPNPR